MKNKPTPEENVSIGDILKKNNLTVDLVHNKAMTERVYKAMQEYAEEYHKEKLKEELSDAFHYGRNTTISFKDYLNQKK